MSDPEKSRLSELALKALQTAESRTVLALIESGFRELGLEKIQGLSIGEWTNRRRVEELQTVLIAVEDQNPAFAAQLSQLIETLKKGS